jgi:site-specific recombinase XerD
MGDAAKLRQVNDRLKKGEGWVGYRYSNNDAGAKVASKYLYFAFYQGKKQKFINSKTNDPEKAYRQLLEARGQVERGDRVLPSDVSRLRYEDLKRFLMDYYREKKPSSLYKRRTEGGGTEETFRGADKLDKFFKRTPVSEITATKLQEFVKWRRKEGDAGPTIRRQLGSLRSAFHRAKALDLITDNHIPTFDLPEDSKARKGFIDHEGFVALRDAMPTHLRPAVTFLYFSGCRSGAAKEITWDMVSRDCTELELPGEIMKNDEPLTLPLVGPLKEIATLLKEGRKAFPKGHDLVFDFTNFRAAWNRTCDGLGLGKYDSKLRHYEGLKPHDFRRSAARNLIKAGVDRRTAMKITGHKTESVFERYNIKTTEDVKEALLKVGQYKTPNAVPIDSADRVTLR